MTKPKFHVIHGSADSSPAEGGTASVTRPEDCFKPGESGIPQAAREIKRGFLGHDGITSRFKNEPVFEPLPGMFSRAVGVSQGEELNAKRFVIRYNPTIFSRLVEGQVSLRPVLARQFALTQIATSMAMDHPRVSEVIKEQAVGLNNRDNFRKTTIWQFGGALAIKYGVAKAYQPRVYNAYERTFVKVAEDYAAQRIIMRQEAQRQGREIPEHLLVIPAAVMGILQPLPQEEFEEIMSKA